jgi:UDP-N-acetylmuramoyl-tripeptide--D-alanyl-D-alanine ligase
MELTAREIAAVTGGALIGGSEDARATSLANDSRTLEPGACFVALVAARDGHEFVGAAFARGATVALVTRAVPMDGATGAVVQVPDALAALAALGTWARDQLADATVVGITGSAGKTSTKDLTAAALREQFTVHATPGSFNAEIGLPITLMGAPRDTELLVLELGARVPGDLVALCAVARPTIGVVTNVGLSHAGPLGGREGVAREKGSVLEVLPPDGLAVLDAADRATPTLVERTAARVILVTTVPDVEADVRAHSVTLDAELRPSFVLDTPWGSGRVCLSLRGEHQVTNAALAATVALDCGVPFPRVATGLAAVRPGQGRMQLTRAASGALVLDDAYNASPASMAAALSALVTLRVQGRRVAVLGEMRELGPDSREEHARVGRLAGDLPIDLLVTVGTETGPLAAAARERGLDAVLEAPDAARALDALHDRVGSDDAVLVKGSRAVGLDVVVRGLVEPEAARRSGTEPARRSGTEPARRSGTEPAP